MDNISSDDGKINTKSKVYGLVCSFKLGLNVTMQE